MDAETNFHRLVHLFCAAKASKCQNSLIRLRLSVHLSSPRLTLCREMRAWGKKKLHRAQSLYTKIMRMLESCAILRSRYTYLTCSASLKMFSVQRSLWTFPVALTVHPRWMCTCDFSEEKVINKFARIWLIGGVVRFKGRVTLGSTKSREGCHLVRFHFPYTNEKWKLRLVDEKTKNVFWI